MEITKNRPFYFNQTLKKSQWTNPIKLNIDATFGPCLKCMGWGKNLVNDKQLCRRCSSRTEIEAAIYDRMGPCLKCKGYGRLLVNQYGHCRRCYDKIPKSELLRQQHSILAIREADNNNEFTQRSQGNKQVALEQLLNEFKVKQKEGKVEDAVPNDMMILQNIQKQQQQQHKRKATRTVSQVHKECVDPLAMQNTGDDITGSFSKAADETAQGPLFQMRPYPNPSQVMKMMQQKKRMI